MAKEIKLNIKLNIGDYSVVPVAVAAKNEGMSHLL